MTYVNPIVGAALTGGRAQQQLSAEKARQVLRQQATARNVAAGGDRFEHVVESAEAVAPVQDDQPRDRRDPRREPAAERDEPDVDEEPSHLDVTG